MQRRYRRNRGWGEVGALFNRGPYPSAGGESIVNATGWEPTAGNPYEVNWLPSMRMVVDFSDLNRAVTLHTTGQSGHAYHPHNADMVDLWRMIQYHRMLLESGGTFEAGALK